MRPASSALPRLILVLFMGLSGAALMGSTAAKASEVASSKKFGLGIYLGQPTGPTLKYHFTQNHALTAAFGVGFWGGQNFHLHVDYGYHFVPKRTGDFDLTFWIGGGLKFFYFYWHDYHPYWNNDPYHDYGRTGLGLRIPLGLSFNLNAVPLEIFLELAPGVAFLPWVTFFADGGVGVRYYF